MKPVLLMILDGWGINPKREANAIELGKTRTWHALINKYPWTQLDASGESVGLRAGLMGNSEVGHLNMGAGRVVWQDITRIDKAVDDGTIARRFAEPFKRSRVHLMGLVSDGGVHSDEKHYMALLKLGPSMFHVFLDGRDTPPSSGIGYVKKLVEAGAKISTIQGRYWAMDRDKRWDRTSKAYHAIVCGEGRKATDPVKAVEEAYTAGETDEFVKPIVIDSEVREGDAVIFFNFRADRARQLTRALTEPDFKDFQRKRWPKVAYESMTRYHEDWKHLPCAFEPQTMTQLLGEVWASQGVKQLRIAETEKYAHVTFFFNGGSDTPFSGEERILVPSQKVATYDLKPEMSAYEVTDNVVKALESGSFNAIVLNYANPDMVGHTGFLEAAIRAVEAVDKCIDRVAKAAAKAGWTLLITADHGNCEQMIDYETREPHTYHTTNPVPFVLVDDARVGTKLREGGSFKDVAPTILDLMGIASPQVMEGRSLL